MSVSWSFPEYFLHAWSGRWPVRWVEGCFEGSAKRIIRLAIEPPGPPAAYAGPGGRSHGLTWNDSSGHWGRRLVCKILPLLHFDRSTLAFGTLSWSYLSLVFVSAVDKKETNMNKLLLETSFLIFSPDREKSKSQRYQNVHDLPNTLLSAGFEIS